MQVAECRASLVPLFFPPCPSTGRWTNLSLQLFNASTETCWHHLTTALSTADIARPLLASLDHCLALLASPERCWHHLTTAEHCWASALCGLAVRLPGSLPGRCKHAVKRP